MSVSGLLYSTGHPATFARFAIVAVTIAAIDIGVLYALHAGLDTNVYLARVPSFAAAITTGYFLNSWFTFHHRTRSRRMHADLTRFLTVFAAGGALNYGVFAVVVACGQEVAPAHGFWLPLAAVWLGGVCGMGFNYLASRRFVFTTA